MVGVLVGSLVGQTVGAMVGIVLGIVLGRVVGPAEGLEDGSWGVWGREGFRVRVKVGLQSRHLEVSFSSCNRGEAQGGSQTSRLGVRR